MGVEHPAWHQVQGELPVLVDHRVTGVAAALKPHHQIGRLGQVVAQLALALVAPVGADHRGYRHRGPRATVAAAPPAAVLPGAPTMPAGLGARPSTAPAVPACRAGLPARRSAPGAAARRCSRQAAMKPWNSGLGRAGRLVNSGWYCTPMKNGCSGSSGHLHDRLPGRPAREHHAGVLEDLAVEGIELVTVTEPFVRTGGAVERGHARPRLQRHRLLPEPHRPADTFDLVLPRQQTHHRRRGGGVVLGGVGVVQVAAGTRVLHDRRLKPVTQAEQRQPAGAGVGDAGGPCPPNRGHRSRRVR